MYRLLIIEDDMGIAEAIRDRAEAWSYQVRTVQDFRNVLEEFESFAPHLILLDISLPFFNGYYWCGELRKRTKAPIVFLSSAADNLNIVMAMNLGADDFIAKPFDLNVLMAKLQALLRRCYDFSAAAPLLCHRGAALDTEDRSLRTGETVVPLTKNEYRILFCLLESKGKVVSRERLMERLWETDQFVDENTLTVNVNRLRRKLDAAGLPGFIATRFGEGYQIPPEDSK